MKPRAIFIAAFNRPRHLRVCLESIRRCSAFNQWDVFVDFDGGAKTDFSVCESVINHFAIHRNGNLGCQRHPTEVLRSALYLGYKTILYVEDDMLLHPGALDWLLLREIVDSSTSLQHGSAGHEFACCHVSNSPFTIKVPAMESIVKFMDAKAFLGMNNVLTGKPITDAEKFHDVCWYAWAVANQNIVRFAPKPLALNFGFAGTNFKNKEFDKAAFGGAPESWFDGVLKTAALPQFNKISRTPGFSYT